MFEREWGFYLDDMILFSEKVLAYTEGLDQESFEADEKAYDATIRKLELIGESATHIPEAIRKASSSISWRQVVATRNRLIHGYLEYYPRRYSCFVARIKKTKKPELIIKQ